MATKRLMALDVLRGLTIALMIMVNTPGSWEFIYPPLRHSVWNGCTPTDLVFPFFLFIVGVSMWFSFKKMEKGITKKSLYKILKRSAIMFSLGVFLNLYPKFDIENLRVFGVLQRIAIVYFFGALLCLQFNIKTLFFIFCGILVSYWGILYLSVPLDPFELATNVVAKLDLFLLGENHLYKGFGIPFDPEGLLSALPSIGTLMMGYFTGKLIESSETTFYAIKKLVIIGSIATFIGWFWGFIFPINKALWTSTYVLYTGGLAMVFLAFLLWIIDEKGLKKWARPFIHFGTNPLFIYIFSGVYVLTIGNLVKIPVSSEKKISGYHYLFSEIFSPIAGNMIGSLLFAIVHIIFFWAITYILYKKKIFIKI